MSYSPQNQDQPAQKKDQFSSQGVDDGKNAETSKTGFNKDKVEPRTGGMKDKDEACSTDKSSQGSPKSSSNA